MQKPSPTLLTAAMAGLMGLGLSACGKETKEKIVTVTQTKGTVSSKIVKSYTLAEFETDCLTRGGWVELHASCGGVNTCKGFSYSYGKVIEHTCKAANTCAGMSCVELATDQSRTGAQILTASESDAMSSGPYCSNCHGAGTAEFELPVLPGTDETAAKAAFAAKTDKALAHSIAFGIHGIRSDGKAYANMPGFYQTYSRKEIESVVATIRALPLKITAWKDPE